MQRIFTHCWWVGLAAAILFASCSARDSTQTVSEQPPDATSTSKPEDDAVSPQEDLLKRRDLSQAADGQLASPVRLEADGTPIDIGKLSSFAHAGPWVADVDGDGDRDLLVGDFPGYFWLFENESDDQEPVYTSQGKLQAGGEDAKTPVY